MKKLLSMFLALSLSLTLALPALAYEDTDPPLWQEWGYDSLEEYLDYWDETEEEYAAEVEEYRAWLDWKAAYTAAHPDEVAAFDADAWFAEQYAWWSGGKEDYMSTLGLDSEAAFRDNMLNEWFSVRKDEADRQDFMDAYEAEHPGTFTSFDADAYFESRFQWWSGGKEDYMSSHGYETEEDFRAAMLDRFIAELRLRQSRKDQIADLSAGLEEEIAAFDADAWFADGYAVKDSYYTTKEEFMYYEDLYEEEDFRDVMLLDYLEVLAEQRTRQERIDAYEAEHPGAVDAFDPLGFLAENYPGYQDPKAKFMERYGLATDEDFFNYLFCAYLDAEQAKADRQAKLDAFEAEHPGVISGFDADTYFKEHYYYESKEEFMRYMELETESDLQDYLLDDYLSQYRWEDEWKAQADADKEAMGGVPGELGIMLNGSYLTFPEGRDPYAKNGATFADAETLSAALGVDIPTPVDGFVSLRSAAEAAGYEVLWDQQFETAVLMDPKLAAAAIDEDFTVLNGALSTWAADPEKNYKSDIKGTLEATLFDSLDGDRTVSMTFDGKGIQSADGLEMSGKYDMSGLLSLIMSETSYTPDEEQMEALNAMMKGSYDYRMDLDGAMLYLRMSMLDAMAEQLGQDWPAGSWFAVPMDEMGVEAPSYDAVSVGSLLCTASYAYATSPAYRWQDLMDTGAELSALLGDAQFAAGNGGQTVTLNRETLTALTGEGSYPYYSLPDEFTITLTVKKSGAITGTLECREEGYSSYSPTTSVTADWDLSFSKQELNMEVHIKNQMKLTIEMTGSTSVTNQKPQVTPPEGDRVVTQEELSGQ